MAPKSDLRGASGRCPRTSSLVSKLPHVRPTSRACTTHCPLGSGGSSPSEALRVFKDPRGSDTA
eukprot:1227732-Alexandrium_andersonii.AAC.1